MIYVFTAIMNGWDNLRPPVTVSPGVRYVCFTDIPNLPPVDPWEYRPLHAAGAPCRTARVPKLLPHLMLPEAEYSIYHDGNLQLKVAPRRLVDSLLSNADWAAHRHPCRTCIYQEAEVLLNEGIGTSRLVAEEIMRYRAEGYPAHRGLWANGMLVRRHTAEVAALNESWWRLYAAGCERDQLSFPVAASKSPVRIKTIDADIFDSPHLNYYWHAAWKDQPSSQEFQPERAALRAKLASLHDLTGSRSPYPEY